MKKVEVYSVDNGFTTIDDPLFFIEDENGFEQDVERVGYKKTMEYINEDFPLVQLFSFCEPDKECEYPYFCVVDIHYEGRLCFFKKWYDLTHFLSNHCSWAANFDLYYQLRFIENKLEKINV